MIVFQYLAKINFRRLYKKSDLKNTVCILAILPVLFTACTGKKTTVQDAKQVALDMRGESFSPPPRRINDILSILAQPGYFDDSIVKRHKVLADKSPPATESPTKLAAFYLQRGQAAFQLFRLNQATEDLQTALKHAEKAIFYNEDVILQNLGFTELEAGNFTSGIQFLERSTSAKGFNNRDNFRRGLTYIHLMKAYTQSGDLEMVEKIQNKSRIYFRQVGHNDGGLPGPKIHRAYMRAFTLEAKGRLAKAEMLRRFVIDAMSIYKNGYPSEYIASRIYLVQNLIRQNRLIEAELEIRRTIMESIGLSHKDSAVTGKLIGQLGEILQKQGRLQDAEDLIKAGIHIIEAAGISADSYMMANTRILLANVLTDRKNYLKAMQAYDLARDGLRENQYLYDRLLTLNQNFMLTLLKTGQLTEALQFISGSYAKFEKMFGKNHYWTAEIRALRGMAYAKTKDLRQAVEDFTRSLPVLFEANMARESDFSARQRFKMIIEAYIDVLVEIHKSQRDEEFMINAAAEAFKMADAIRGQAVQGALGASGARAAAGSAELADLVRKEQDSRQQINMMQAILTNALATAEEQRNPGAIENLKNKVDVLKNSRRTLLEKIKRQFPKYLDFTDPQPAALNQAQAQLKPGEVLISIYTSETNTYVWTIPYKDEAKFSITALGRKETRKIVDSLRQALAPDPQTLGDIPDFDLRLAYRLYSTLLQPSESTWRKATELIIVAPGLLGRLPLAILPTSLIEVGKAETTLFGKYRNIPWLIRQAAITRCPTVSSFVTLRNLPKNDSDRRAFAGFGDPYFNQAQLTQEQKEQRIHKHTYAKLDNGLKVRGIRITRVGSLDNEKITSSHLNLLNRLPDTAEEIKSIATALDADPARDLFLGKEASEQRVKSMDLSDRRVIAFATHALVPGDLDGLDQPALALCSPAVTGEKEDGLLTMGEILKLNLNADWIVLSACNTGAADGAGTEAVSGLGRAFFYAGSRAILVSMWPVETTSARKLTTSLFRYQKADKTLTRARALQKSMLHLIDGPGFVDRKTGSFIATYAHPFFWAPFIVVGDSTNN